MVAAAREQIAAKQRADETVATLDALRQQLTALANQSNEQGGGVSVSRFWKSGAIDYKRVPELAAVDLEQYRGAQRDETRVTILK